MRMGSRGGAATRRAFAAAALLSLSACSKTGLNRPDAGAEARDAQPAQDSGIARAGSGGSSRDSGAGQDARVPADAANAPRDAARASDADTPCASHPDLNWSAAGWSEERLARSLSGYDAFAPRLALYRDGSVAIVHHLSGSSVMEAGIHVLRSKPDGGFVTELVGATSDSQGHATAFARERLAISYSAAGSLRVARERDGGWEEATAVVGVPEANTARSALALDGSDRAHLVYFVGDALRYAVERDGGDWADGLIVQAERIGRFGLALDAEDRPRVTFQIDGEGGGLRYAEGPAPWRITTIVDEPIDAHALALDRDGHAHLALLMRPTRHRAVHHADDSTGAWRFETIEAPSEPGVDLDATEISIALAGRDVHIAVASRPGLAHFAEHEGRWTSELVRSRVETVSSVAVDAAGAVHVAGTMFMYPHDRAVHYLTNRELALDGVDENCDGADGTDADGDGLASRFTGGKDCDDGDASVGDASPETGACPGRP